MTKTVQQINTLLDDLDNAKALLVTTEDEAEVSDTTNLTSSTDSSSDTKTDESKVRRRRKSLEKRRKRIQITTTEKQGTRSDKGENS